MTEFNIICKRCGFDGCYLVSMYSDQYDYNTDEHYEILDAVGISCPECGKYVIID